MDEHQFFFLFFFFNHVNVNVAEKYCVLGRTKAQYKCLNNTTKCKTNMTTGKEDSERRWCLLCVASDFLFNLSGLKDALSFLEN